jgi:hypothetical protein
LKNNDFSADLAALDGIVTRPFYVVVLDFHLGPNPSGKIFMVMDSARAGDRFRVHL